MEAVLAHIWLREEARLSTRRIREARYSGSVVKTKI